MNIFLDLIRYAIAAYKLDSYKDPMFAGAKFSEMLTANDRVIMVKDDNRVVIAFRGTSSVMQWITNAEFWPALEGKTIEQGFYDGWAAFKGGVSTYIQLNPTENLYFTGHSRGAALAVLAARHAAKNMHVKCTLINFESPLVFTAAGRDEYNALYIPSYSTVNGSDIVCDMPSRMGYYSYGTRVRLKQNFWHRYPPWNLQDHLIENVQKTLMLFPPLI